MTPHQFSEFLVQLSPSRVVFESCSGVNYWSQQCRALGHEARLLSMRLVMAVRQNQKTDKNDALAIVQATLYRIFILLQARRPGKTHEDPRHDWASNLMT